jgi:hypothetical protein
MTIPCSRPDRYDGSRRSPAVPWRILAVLVAASASMVAIAAEEDRADIEPDAAVQAAIKLVADADDRAQQQATLERLEKLEETSPEQFVRQMAYFASRAPNTKQALAEGVIMRRLEVPDETIARALAPCLETTDVEVAKSVRNILGGLETRAAGRRPDFSLYRGIIADRVRNGETLPMALIRYMYDADAGMAMLALMRAHQLRTPEEIKRILWAEHVLSNVLWKQQYGFLRPTEVEPAASEELSSLATHEAWWARLFVAEIMRQHTAFRQPELINALVRDANATVREAATRALPTTTPASQP